MQAHDATRMVAVVGGVLGLGLFYQPWVEGNVPGLPAPVALTGYDLAVGRARDLADAATAPPPRISVAAPGASGPVAGAAPAAPAGGLSLPTRVPTFAPGAAVPTPVAAAGSGGLTLPTRVPTFAPGAAVPTPVAAAGSGGLTLPTRVPTFAPGATAPTPAVAVTRAAVTPAAPASGASTGGSGLLAAARAATGTDRPPPAELPKLTLYAVPVAGGGVAAFAATFGLLRDQRDRRFAKWWTVLFSLLGAWTTGTVISAVVGAQPTNSLLAPGQATGVLWPAWGALAAFVTSFVGLAWTWIALARRESAS